MARNASQFPTELELEILKVLWRDQPCTVREVRDALSADRDLAYTTVMTVMGIMAKKKYVKRRKQKSTFVYQAIWTAEATSQGMLNDVVDRVFEGSKLAVMQQLLETSDLDDSELSEIRKLLSRRNKK